MKAEYNKEQLKANSTQWIENSKRYNKGDQSIVLIEELTKALLGEIPFNTEMVSEDKLLFNKEFHSFVGIELWQNVSYYDIHDKLVKAIFSRKLNDSYDNYFWSFVARRIHYESDHSFISFLVNKGYDEEYLFLKILQGYRNGLVIKNDKGYQLSSVGEYYKDKMKDSKSLLGLKTNKGYSHILINLAFNGNYYDSNIVFYTGIYLYLIDPELIEPNFEDFIILKKHNSLFHLNFFNFLMEENAEKYGYMVAQIITKYPIVIDTLYNIYATLNHKTLVDYSEKIEFYGKQYINKFYVENQRIYDGYCIGMPISVHYFNYLYEKDKILFENQFSQFIEKTQLVTKEQLNLLSEKYGQEGLGFIMPIFYSKKEYITEKTVHFIFEYLNKYDYTSYIPTLIAYLVNYAGKKEKVLMAEKLNVLPDIASDGIELLNGKTVGDRVVGALLLSNLKPEDQTTQIVDILNNAIDKETNDETRNIMLESVMEDRFSTPFDKERAILMVEKASQRKKLNRWSEKWLDEGVLGNLYWSDGSIVGQDGLRFLLYRMKQTSGLQSDIEAKQLIRNLDLEKSEKLALQLLQAFIDSNSDSKIKYYLTLCGLLGSDNVLNKLHALFRKSVTDKRAKMAEYVLGAIAMVGNDKALRILEVISRKYANKKPKLSQKALESLDAAAEELGITKDQLADRIIPNFDFDGIFKEFDVEGDTYRAFVNKDFQLVYYDEYSKMRKSVPRGIEPELKKEFSAIAKEIRDVVKSQSDRLEKYMVESREWQSDDWQTFFFNNPIMFVYAMQLLWLRKDNEGNILDVFYCDEDAEIYNFEDEEVTLDETDVISILHPLNLEEKTLLAWKEKAFENDIKTIFPILERPIFRKLPEELESSISKRYNNQEIPKGADFVAPQLVKRGWYKSTGDGGYLEFSRRTLSGDVTAVPYIEGPAAWYQQNTAKAEIHNITFIGKTWKDKILIKDVPDTFYSEVMADMDYLIKAE